jgi:guanylate kinase
MLDKLTSTRTKLDTRISTHSDAYNSIRDFQSIKKKFGDVEFTFDASPELKNLDGLYKQGGSINRNKINKFLNYAKG